MLITPRPNQRPQPTLKAQPTTSRRPRRPCTVSSGCAGPRGSTTAHLHLLARAAATCLGIPLERFVDLPEPGKRCEYVAKNIFLWAAHGFPGCSERDERLKRARAIALDVALPCRPHRLP